MHLAVKEGFKDIVEYLIEMSANINSKNDHHSTALHLACVRGDTEIFRILIQKNADIEATDKNGNTPIHILAQYGYINLIKYLQSVKNLSLLYNIKNKKGQTPYDISKNPKAKQLLQPIAFSSEKLAVQLPNEGSIQLTHKVKVQNYFKVAATNE